MVFGKNQRRPSAKVQLWQKLTSTGLMWLFSMAAPQEISRELITSNPNSLMPSPRLLAGNPRKMDIISLSRKSPTVGHFPLSGLSSFGATHAVLA